MINDKKKVTSKIIEIRLPIYKDVLYVDVYTPDDKLFEFLNKEGIELTQEDKEILTDRNCGARCFYYPEKQYGVIRVMQKTETTAKLISYIVHELLHYVAIMLRERGFELTQASEEAYTYLLEYLTLKVLDNI